MSVTTVTSKILKFGFKQCMKMSVCVQNLNPILGESTWDFQEDHYDYHQEVARSSYADMLHDTERNQMYFDALKLAIDKMHAMGREAKVLDIGTGTGLLSMMAVKCGADSVVACEAFLPMSECAQEIINLNELDDEIKIISKHSTDLTVGENGDMPEKANILVTEVFDTELIGEGALMTFTQAHKDLLETDCIVIPSSATVYAQVVESPVSQNWNRFNDICDSNGDLLLETPITMKNCPGTASVHDIQLSQLPITCFKEIVPPQPVLKFNWMKKDGYSYFKGRNIMKVKAEQDGTAQIVFMWWELAMDTENKIILSCAPYWAHPLKQVNPNLTSADIPWRDHWMQALYYLPQAVEVKKDQEFSLITTFDEYSLWFHVDPILTPINQKYEKPLCDCGLHISHSRTMIGQLNDVSRNTKYISIMKKYINQESVVLIISDGFYLGLAAAKLGAKKIIYLDDNYLSTRVLREFIKFNNINNIEIVETVEALKTNESIKEVNLVLGLPHFSSTILPWDSLFFAYLVRKIRDVLPQNAVIAPRTCSVKGLVVEFKDLQKIRQPIETCGEFDMKPFDDMIVDSSCKCDAKVEAQPLWEYPSIARSPVTELATLDLETMFDHKNISTQGEFTLADNTKKYNGIVLWVDWDLDGTGENIISTGPIVPPVIGELVQWDVHTRQGVRFTDYKIKDGVYAACNFKVAEGKMSFTFC